MRTASQTPLGTQQNHVKRTSDVETGCLFTAKFEKVKYAKKKNNF